MAETAVPQKCHTGWVHSAPASWRRTLDSTDPRWDFLYKDVHHFGFQDLTEHDNQAWNKQRKDERVTCFFWSWWFLIGQSPKLLLTSATVMEIGEITSRKLDHWPATVSSEALKSLTHCRCIVCVYPLAIKCNVAIDTPLQMEVYSWEIIYSINAGYPIAMFDYRRVSLLFSNVSLKYEPILGMLSPPSRTLATLCTSIKHCSGPPNGSHDPFTQSIFTPSHVFTMFFPTPLKNKPFTQMIFISWKKTHKKD